MKDEYPSAPEHILVVDDTPANLRLLSSILQQHGYKVRPVTQGTQALSSAFLAPPDAILLDIMMPDMSGYEVCKSLKADARTRDIPVIFISAKDEMLDKITAFSVGGVDYITRPFRPEEVLMRLETHLTLRRVQKRLQKKNARLQQEISERQRVENELRKLSRAVEQSAATIVITNTDGVIEFVNPFFSAITGYTAEEALGQNARILQSGKHSPEFYRRFWQTITSGSVWQGEFINKRKDGSLYWEFAKISPVKDNHGEISHYVAVKEDITERKRVENALRRLEKAVETTEIGVTITDKQGRIVYVNPAEAAMHGYTVKELIGQRSHIFTTPEYRKERDFNCEDAREYKNWTRERINARKDGSTFPVKLISNFIRDVSGAPLGCVTICEDITERKRTEEQLYQLNQQLQEAAASKDKFFSIIAHDLRSPFTALLGFIEILCEAIDDYSREEIKRVLMTIRKSAENVYALLENLLAWSRFQRGLIEYEPEVFDLYDIAEHVSYLFSSNGQQKKIMLDNRVTETSYYVYGDYNMVDTILRNLVSNALKFTEAGGTIVIEATVDDKTITVSVADSGIGMAPEDMTQLFHIDVKYSNPGTDGERGTGLGLILCKDFIERHGGTIWVESAPGQGTTFHFTLPQADAQSA